MYVCVCVSVCYVYARTLRGQRPEEYTVPLGAKGSCEQLDMKDRNSTWVL